MRNRLNVLKFTVLINRIPIFGVPPRAYLYTLAIMSTQWKTAAAKSIGVDPGMANQLGFHNLPFLAHRKSVKKGFEFTLMVVGTCSPV